MPELLEVTKVAKLLKVSESQVYVLMKKKGLPYIDCLGSGRLVLDEDLWEWVRSRSVKHNDEEEG